MIEENEMSFYVNKNGENIKCEILSLVPGENENETYVSFTDFIDHGDGNNYIQYAKIISNGEDYAIEEFENPEIVKELKDKIVDKMWNDGKSKMEYKYD